MIIDKLRQNLKTELERAEEVWIATALLKDAGFSFIQKTLPFNCKQHYLVGIDLPTTPSVLRKMMSKFKKNQFHCAIYKSEQNYHPKVYLIKNKIGFVAFVGSSNLTDGGLENNIELNCKISHADDCLTIREWFFDLYQQGYPITEENIQIYEAKFNMIEEQEAHIKNKRKSITLKKEGTSEGLLDGIDFNDRYFKKEHHLAFKKELWLDNSREAIKERKKAETRFLELNDLLLPRFQEYGLVNLHTNTINNIVSRNHQIDENKPRKLDAMWLSYGKSQADIKIYKDWQTNVEDKNLQTFIHHSRLQIRIELNSIGIWILFGKENQGSIVDRDHFKKNMRNETFRNNFFDNIVSLSDGYWIHINDSRKECNSFSTPDELYAFCKRDDYDKYFIIGRDYKITDPEMSEKNLPNETLKVFKILFPIYEMMKHKL